MVITDSTHQSAHLKEDAQVNEKVGESEQHDVLPEFPHRLSDAGSRESKCENEAAADARNKRDNETKRKQSSEVTSRFCCLW